MAATNVQAFSGDVEVAGGLSITGSVTSTAGLSTSLTPGSYLTGSAYNGSTARTFAVDATTSATNGENKIVARDSNGDIFGRFLYGSYLNMSHAASDRTSDTAFYSSTDDFIRKNTASGMRSSLNVPTRTGDDASGTWDIDIDGNASSSTNVRVDRDDTGDTAMYITMVNNNTASTSKRLYMDTNLIYDNTNNRLRLAQIMLGDQNVYGLGAVAGQYGSVGTVGTGKGSYEGFNINGQWVFMSNGAASCGIYNDTNNEWATKWNQNGSTDLYYNSSNKFQTTNDGAHCSGALYADHYYVDDYIYHNGNTTTRMGFGSNTIYLRTSGLDRVTIDSSGLVGIGTNPVQKLDIRSGNIRLHDANTYGTDRYIYTKWEDANNDHQIGLEFDYYFGSGGTGTTHSRINFVSNATRNVEITGAGKQTTMSVLSNGNVGIGTVNPLQKLDVRGIFQLGAAGGTLLYSANLSIGTGWVNVPISSTRGAFFVMARGVSNDDSCLIGGATDDSGNAPGNVFYISRSADYASSNILELRMGEPDGFLQIRMSGGNTRTTSVTVFRDV